MTLCEFKETIKRATGSQKYVDSLLSNEAYDTCLCVCHSHDKPAEVLACITIWAETTECSDFWKKVYRDLLLRIK